MNTIYPKPFGIGSAFNPDLGSNSGFFNVGEQLVMFDCGETTFWKIKHNDALNGFKHLHIFITHYHSDHIGSLGTLLFYAYYIKKVPVTLYAHPDVFEILDLMKTPKNLYTEVSLHPNKIITEDYKILPILGGLQCTVKAFLTEHAKDMISYGFAVKSNQGESFYWSGDAKSIPNTILKALSENKVHRIYQDCSWLDYPDNVHYSYKSLCQAITDKQQRQKLYLMHLDEGFNMNQAIFDGFNIFSET